MREGPCAHRTHQCFPKARPCRHQRPKGPGGLMGGSGCLVTQWVLWYGACSWVRCCPEPALPFLVSFRTSTELHPRLQCSHTQKCSRILPCGSFAVLLYTFQVLLGEYIWQRAGLSSEQSSPGLFADPGNAVTHICWIK